MSKEIIEIINKLPMSIILDKKFTQKKYEIDNLMMTISEKSINS